jgi:hypothetical protein
MTNVGKITIIIANTAVTEGFANVNPEFGNNSFP